MSERTIEHLEQTNRLELELTDLVARADAAAPESLGDLLTHLGLEVFEARSPDEAGDTS